MSKPLVFLLLIGIIAVGCDTRESSDSLELGLEFQIDSDGRVLNIPVLQLVNRGNETVYVYILPYGHWSEVVDSLAQTIELNFVERERKSPEGYLQTVYQFDYPKIIELDPGSEVRLHSNNINSPAVWELLEAGYSVFATVGYFTDKEMFVGKLDHELMYSIHDFQRTVSSRVVFLDDFLLAK